MTEDIALSWLFCALVALLALSAFFAMSETCLMALNRYRLKHLIREGSHGAKLAGKLLTRTDELLSFILAGNTLINAIFNRDYPVVQGATMMIAVIFIFANLFVDLLYGVLDPRISQE